MGCIHVNHFHAEYWRRATDEQAANRGGRCPRMSSFPTVFVAVYPCVPASPLSPLAYSVSWRAVCVRVSAPLLPHIRRLEMRKVRIALGVGYSQGHVCPTADVVNQLREYQANLAQVWCVCVWRGKGKGRAEGRRRVRCASSGLLARLAARGMRAACVQLFAFACCMCKAAGACRRAALRCRLHPRIPRRNLLEGSPAPLLPRTRALSFAALLI